MTHLVLPGLAAVVCRVGGILLGVTAHPADEVPVTERDDPRIQQWQPWPLIVDPATRNRFRVDLFQFPEHENVGPLPPHVLARIRGGRP